MSEAGVRAILDEGAFFKGTLSFDGTVRLAGEFEGQVESKGGTLIIESTAKVCANIHVRVLILSGYLKGSIRAAEHVSMHPPAHFEGDVISPSLQIEEGVCFEGTNE